MRSCIFLRNFDELAIDEISCLEKEMSLASIVASLISPILNNSQKNSSKLGVVDNGTTFVEVMLGSNNNMAPEAHQKESRPSYVHAMIAGGLGGTTGDFLMHSLDTVKTRQQGDTHTPPKYTSMSSSYSTILRQEGIRRGLYGGWVPALLGSFPGTVIFFGTYEYSKRNMIDAGISPHISYLMSGFLADLAASIVYVPSEVLKTRLQLQGRYNNPFFNSGYNYKSTLHAVKTIVHQEGLTALFYGYKATVYRDLPFSALQFFFYEQGQSWAKNWKKRKDIGLKLELITGAAAGGLAGVITCPLDVVKTRTQTQVNFNAEATYKSTSSPFQDQSTGVDSSLKRQIRSTPSLTTYATGSSTVDFNSSSVVNGLKLIYKSEGLPGWFRGVGPRVVWTSVQSGCMLFLYQKILRELELHKSYSSLELSIG